MKEKLFVSYLGKWCARIAYTSAFSGIVISIFAAKHTLNNEEKFWDELAEVQVIAPLTSPEPGQDNIDLALTLYGIKLPPNTAHPKYDPNLRDRGLTTKGAFMEKTQVTIGPSAFASWALLASTLAHEIEIHCQQNFAVILLMDSFGYDGTGEAERQAYNHELAYAERFGLTNYEQKFILDTVSYYYPLAYGNNARSQFSNWLARNLLQEAE